MPNTLADRNPKIQQQLGLSLTEISTHYTCHTVLISGNSVVPILGESDRPDRIIISFSVQHETHCQYQDFQNWRINRMSKMSWMGTISKGGR